MLARSGGGSARAWTPVEHFCRAVRSLIADKPIGEEGEPSSGGDSGPSLAPTKSIREETGNGVTPYFGRALFCYAEWGAERTECSA